MIPDVLLVRRMNDLLFLFFQKRLEVASFPGLHFGTKFERNFLEPNTFWGEISFFSNMLIPFGLLLTRRTFF
jgi:hypothetical protein